MRVTFQAGLEDFTETTYLSLKLAGRLVPWYRRITSWAGLFVGLAGGRFLATSEPAKLIWAMAIGCTLIVLDEFFYRKLIFKRTRDFYIRRHGHQIPARVEMRLTETGLLTKQFETETNLSWSELAAINETKDALYFVKNDGGVAAVRKRGFDSEADCAAFLKTARGNMRATAKS